MLIALLFRQRLSAAACSSSFSAESEPPNAVGPWMNCWRRADDPTLCYFTVAPGQAAWYFLAHSSIAFFCALEPEALMLPVAHRMPPVVVPPVEPEEVDV